VEDGFISEVEGTPKTLLLHQFLLVRAPDRNNCNDDAQLAGWLAGWLAGSIETPSTSIAVHWNSAM
jgi:hypothetical protein